MKRLENPTSDYPRIHSSTLYSSGGSAVFNILLATLTSTLSVMVLEESVRCSETKNNPNTFQTEKRLLDSIICRIHGCDNEKDSIIRMCIHNSLKSLLGQALQSLALYIFEHYTRTLETELPQE